MTSSASKLPRPEPAACPSDKTFTRLLEGTLSDGEVQALQAHGDGCPACGRTLAELARTMTPGQGDWLGERFQLLEPLGIGGMGVVYTAFDSKLQRKVAVKRLRELAVAGSAERRRARFLREAQLLASLSHPNVLTVHDVGVDPELYVVMELVDGWPMSRWISEAEPRPDWRRILDLYLQAGRGLSAAHQLGVVHRDVKPENILVARNGRVLIGDFGLAGLAEVAGGTPDPSALPTGLTQTGSVLGTPAYMAPEQHEGKPADALSDQFSFCVSLYESLHGRRPFAGQTGGEIAAAVRTGQPPAGGDGISREVDRVIARGLALIPARRYPSMDALLSALVEAAARRPVKPVLIAGASCWRRRRSSARIGGRRRVRPSCATKRRRRRAASCGRS
jgi:serine/threonine protein kinase